jgi:membrane protease YdiL (CAAX protease family)
MVTASRAWLDGGFWRAIWPIIRAVAIGVIVAEVGISTWGALLATTSPRVAALAMLGVLVVYCLFFSGRIAFLGMQAAQRENFRATSLTPVVWAWGLVGAGLFVIALEASIFTLFRLIPYPAEQFVPLAMPEGTTTFDMWLVLLVASLAAGVCEETGFRGYMQRPLEGRYGAGAAIAITTLAFAALHSNQPWAITLAVPILFASAMLGALAYVTRSLLPGIVAHSVMDVFNFGYWWTSLWGHYDRQTIFITGIDGNFLAWAGILTISTALFVLVIHRLGALASDASRASPL